MKPVIFKLNNKLQINSIIDIIGEEFEYRYIIKKYLGKGTSGRVFLLRNENMDDDDLVMKVSIDDYKVLQKEINRVIKKFSLYNKEYSGKPLYYGPIQNYNNLGIIYPYCGFTNLEVFKEYNYNFDLETIKSMIKQLIIQLKNLYPLVHCDIKPSNIVIDYKKSDWIVSIIDYGLLKHKNEKLNIISTSYITSPETLYTTYLYDENINIVYDKVDYIGLFIVCLNFFLHLSPWTLISDYLMEYCSIPSNYLYHEYSVYIFVYMFFRFNYKTIDEVKDENYKNIIRRILITFPFLEYNDFLNWNDFYENILLNNLKYEEDIKNLKDFLFELIRFEHFNRNDFDSLLGHKFLL